ncbi:MAG: hypothetical protein M1814_006300 [Vezdaea aestivalis]|nr:MAG: hypothetical protein M1814_006300 [Vezdaea aestivalis]
MATNSILTNWARDSALTNGQTINAPNSSTGLDTSTSATESDQLLVLCGPLLNYKYMYGASADNQGEWQGSVLIVTKPTDTRPELRISCTGSVSVHDGAPVNVLRVPDLKAPQPAVGVKLYEDAEACFWRFDLSVPFYDFEARWTYNIPGLRFESGEAPEKRSTASFYVPSKDQSMRIMFHSCNGFSVGTDEDAWSGPALWNDVLRTHDRRPFHVMIGGGDQVYNDSIRVSGPLQKWTGIASVRERREYPFGPELNKACDTFYCRNYIKWYSTEPFQSANCVIPQVNIWDDHDIIDGFGSYADNFMRSSVFKGIGSISYKYYLLFQHHAPPPTSTYVSNAPQAAHAEGGEKADSARLKDTYVNEKVGDEPGWILGSKPGPYIEQRSRSLWMQLGKHIGFVGIDARTERTMHTMNYPETYKLIWERVNRELTTHNGQIRHLIVLIGVPIAYPRLEWLARLFDSPIIAPIRLLNKHFGIAKGFFNPFNSEPDLRDDINDSPLAHKAERKELITSLQHISERQSVRVTILSGDVHLAAMGRFYSKPKLGIPLERDHRFIPNVISSAITNKPPPRAVADLLDARNKIHHFDHHTHETMMNIFDEGPGGSTKAAARNHSTMPSRNYAVLTLNEKNVDKTTTAEGNFRLPKTGRDALHPLEVNAGAKHPAASGMHLETDDTPAMALQVSLRVEIDQHDREGRTDGYGIGIPALTKV